MHNTFKYSFYDLLVNRLSYINEQVRNNATIEHQKMSMFLSIRSAKCANA